MRRLTGPRPLCDAVTGGSRRRAASASGADLTRDRAAAARASEMQRVANGADGEGFNWAMQKAGPVFARWPERVKATRADSL